MEVTKNIVLNGVGEVFLALKMSEKKIVDLDFLRFMNPQVKFMTEIITEEISLDDFKNFDYVVLLNMIETATVFRISTFCRSNSIPLSWAASFGMISFFINDWGNYVSICEIKYTARGKLNLTFFKENFRIIR
jgi:hypothetical protein